MHIRTVLVLALTLGGCSVSGVVTDWISDDAAGAEPINYRYVVATMLDSILGAKDRELRTLEISRPRRVDLVKGAAWLVCLRSLPTSARQPPIDYSIIIQREKYLESRIAVGTDQCQIQPYVPFDWSAEAKKPPVLQ